MKGENSGAYSHKLFVRDQPLLCLHMRRAMKSNAKECQDNLPPSVHVLLENGQLNKAPMEPSESNVAEKPKKPRKPRAKKETDKQSLKKGNNKNCSFQNEALPAAKDDITVSALEPITQITSESEIPLIDISHAKMLPLEDVMYMNNSCDNNQATLFPINQQQHYNTNENFHENTNHRHQQQRYRPSSVGDVTRALVEEGEEMEILGEIKKSAGLELHNHNDNDDWEEAIMSQVMNRLSKSEISPSPTSYVREKQTSLLPREPAAMAADMASMPSQGSGGGYNQVSTSLLAIHRQFFTGLAANFAQQQQRMSATAVPTDSSHNDLSFQNTLQHQVPNSILGSFPNINLLKGDDSRSDSLHHFPPNATNNNNCPHHLSCDISVDSGNFSTNSHKLDLLSDAALTFRTPFMQEMRLGDGGNHIAATEDDKPAIPKGGWAKEANRQGSYYNTRRDFITTTKDVVTAKRDFTSTRKDIATTKMDIQRRLSAARIKARRSGSIMKSPMACTVKETKGFTGHIV